MDRCPVHYCCEPSCLLADKTIQINSLKVCAKMFHHLSNQHRGIQQYNNGCTFVSYIDVFICVLLSMPSTLTKVYIYQRFNAVWLKVLLGSDPGQ